MKWKWSCQKEREKKEKKKKLKAGEEKRRGGAAFVKMHLWYSSLKKRWPAHAYTYIKIPSVS